MKADLFLLVAAACVAGVFAYALLGGLVVRVVNALKPFGHDGTFDDDNERGAAAIFWPVVLAAVVAVGLSYHVVVAAYRLSQWRPKPKSALPGARVVKP